MNAGARLGGNATVTVPALRDAVAAAVVDWPGVTAKRTFGCPAFLVRGEVFALVSEQGLSLTRLGGGERRKLVETRGARPFVASGRTVERWPTVAVEPAELAALLPALRSSYEATVRG